MADGRICISLIYGLMHRQTDTMTDEIFRHDGYIFDFEAHVVSVEGDDVRGGKQGGEVCACYIVGQRGLAGVGKDTEPHGLGYGSDGRAYVAEADNTDGLAGEFKSSRVIIAEVGAGGPVPLAVEMSIVADAVGYVQQQSKHMLRH